ncbi:McrC family protein [Nafulsella turpanensis]|uniref:McrC family protein n=1 Tax=Nafulsella turpanensis TaxID=1265690 RepID=UPI00034A4BB3|nr:hypothetical protein [Nafulsella turpanensis]
MINLFEYQNKEPIPGWSAQLEEFLDTVWNSREKSGYYFEQEDRQVEVQQFLQFLHKSGEVKSSKYVGVIHFEGHKINLLPKIFYHAEKEYTEQDVNAIQNHVLWWLSYCRKIKFPNYQTSLGSIKSDFFEVLIYLFAKYTRQLLSNAIYQQYEEVNRELSFIKGRVNINEYINENLSRGRWHKLNCTYDAFIFDNKFNRIIKYVTTLLFNATTSLENKKYLREILFIFDEVSDIRATPEESESIQFNPMFSDFETVRDYCTLFLRSCVSFNYKNDLQLFAFLLPMEYVFEDFLFGFIDKELEEVKATAQSSSIHLDQEENFSLKPDLLLELASKRVIADAKYKMVYTDEKDPKKGISQPDLYQMLAYAVRYKVQEVFLFYPESITNEQAQEGKMTIKDEFAENVEVEIKAYQLPILNRELFANGQNEERELAAIFEATRKGLANRLKEILGFKKD